MAASGALEFGATSEIDDRAAGTRGQVTVSMPFSILALISDFYIQK